MALLSKGKLSNMMLERLLELPMGMPNIKDFTMAKMGNLIVFSTQKELKEAWDETKKKATKQYPEKFILDEKNTLHWNDGSIKVLDKKIAAANFKKLNELAEIEGCNVNSMVTKLISFYQKNKK